jgi:hypothetical protein
MYLLLSLLVALVYAKAPLLDSEHAEIVAGQYIVVYHPSTDRMMQIKHQYQFGSNVFATYNITNEFMGCC